MSDIFVTVNGKRYSLEDAERLGYMPKKQVINSSSRVSENEIEIIVDEDTKSFSLQVNDKEPVDIPKGMLIDIFEVSGFRSIASIIEEDGVDDDVLEDLAKSLKLI